MFFFLNDLSKVTDSPDADMEPSDVSVFETDITTKGIGPVTKYSRSGKVRNIICMNMPSLLSYLLFTPSAHSTALVQVDYD